MTSFLHQLKACFLFPKKMLLSKLFKVSCVHVACSPVVECHLPILHSFSCYGRWHSFSLHWPSPVGMRVAESFLNQFRQWLTSPLLVCVVCVSILPSVHRLPAVCPWFLHSAAGLPALLLLLLLLCVLAAVHQNMALLPTGITSARSALMRSRATVWPWATTRLSRRRKFQLPPGDGRHCVSKSVSRSIRRELGHLF